MKEVVLVGGKPHPTFGGKPLPSPIPRKKAQGPKLDVGPWTFGLLTKGYLVSSSTISLAPNTLRSTSNMPRESTEIARFTDSS